MSLRVITPLLFFLILLCFTSCKQEKKELPGFVSEQWIKDPRGCQGIRISMEKDLRNNLENITGLPENDILAILGPPDANELYKRNQKFFVYHLTPAASCESITPDSRKILQIRFSATNMAKEVMILEEE